MWTSELVLWISHSACAKVKVSPCGSNAIPTPEPESRWLGEASSVSVDISRWLFCVFDHGPHTGAKRMTSMTF